MKHMLFLTTFIVVGFVQAQTQPGCEEYSKKIDNIVASDPKPQFKSMYDANLVSTLFKEGSVDKNKSKKITAEFKKSKPTIESTEKYLNANSYCIFSVDKLAKALLEESRKNKVALKHMKHYLKSTYISPTYTHLSLMFGILSQYECELSTQDVCKKLTEAKKEISNKMKETAAVTQPSYTRLVALKENPDLKVDPKDLEIIHAELLKEIDFSQKWIKKYSEFSKSIK